MYSHIAGITTGESAVSGYEKSPDYGGGDPPNWFWVLCIAVALAVIGAARWLRG
jgi:hypothetical protein